MLLLIGWAGLLAAFGANSLNETNGTGADRPSAAILTEQAAPTPAALVRAHAGEARTVEGVHCEQIVEGTFVCAVTFTGPACQLWQVADGEATDIGPVIASVTGSRSAGGVRCGASR